MKTEDQIVMSVPLPATLAHQARIAAATLNVSRVEFVRRAMKSYLKIISTPTFTDKESIHAIQNHYR